MPRGGLPSELVTELGALGLAARSGSPSPPTSQEPSSQGGQGNQEELSVHPQSPVRKGMDGAWEKRAGHSSGDQSWEHVSCPNLGF